MQSSQISYEPGEILFAPFLGLCTVTGSSLETVLGVQLFFYELQSHVDSSRVKVPASQMSSRGIRPAMSSEQLEQLLSQDHKVADSHEQENFQRRLRRWTQTLRSTHPSSNYEFLREWQLLAENGTRFNARESEIRDKALQGMISEIAHAFQISAKDAETKLHQWLGADKS